MGTPLTVPRTTWFTRGGPGSRSRRVWPLTGRTGGANASGSPAAVRRPRAGGEDNGARGDAGPVVEADADGAVAGQVDLGRRGQQARARGSGGGDQRGVQQPRVDLVVGPREQPAGKPRGERGLQFAQLPPGQQPGRQAEPGAEGVQVTQRGDVGAVPGDLDGAAGEVAGGQPGGVGEFGGERGVAAQRVEVEAQQRGLRVVQLGDRREHSCRGVPGTAVRVRVNDGDPQAALGAAPRGRGADDAGPDDDDVAAGGVHAPSRRHYPDQVLRSARALSAFPAAPVV